MIQRCGLESLAGLWLQQSRELLERLKYMDAFETQNFDTTVRSLDTDLWKQTLMLRVVCALGSCRSWAVLPSEAMHVPYVVFVFFL